MKMFFKVRYAPAVLLLLMAAPAAQAATSPSLGAAASYSVLSGAGATNGGAGNTTISGDLGVYPAASYTDVGTTIFATPGNPHLADVSAHNAQVAQKAVFDGPLDFVAQPCTVNYFANTELSTLGPLVPGVYCTDPTHDFTISGTVTLQGTGSPATDVWIFRSSRDLIGSGTANIVFTGTGGLPCNVWWRVANNATFTANNAMVGNILAANSITFGQSATLNGRAFAYTAAVTMLGNAISGPTCTPPVPPAPTSSPQTPPLINLRKVPSPLALPNGPGSVTYNYTVTNPGKIPITNVTLTDDKCSLVQFVSGDTNGNSQLDINETWIYKCTTTLNQTTVNYATVTGLGNGMAAVDTAIAEVVVGVPIIPPIIHILKTPDPLTLPFNGGSVKYTYTVTNPGTVALTGVTVTDDKCSNVTLVSGDGNGDGKLQPAETWTYTCTTNVPVTTTNTAIATGHANGLTAFDTALATVVVAGQQIPPFIHIVKKPEPFILPATGGLVTYTYMVSNPGTVPLSDVTVTDNKCSPLTLISGDGNGDGLMQTYETWTYTCHQNLKATTTNTATATGHANGMTVTDISVANVTLSPALLPPPPKLPNTGIGPMDESAAAMVVAAGIFIATSLLFALHKDKRLFQ